MASNDLDQLELSLSCIQCKAPLEAPIWSNASCAHVYHAACTGPVLAPRVEKNPSATHETAPCPHPSCSPTKRVIWTRNRPLEAAVHQWEVYRAKSSTSEGNTRRQAALGHAEGSAAPPLAQVTATTVTGSRKRPEEFNESNPALPKPTAKRVRYAGPNSSVGSDPGSPDFSRYTEEELEELGYIRPKPLEEWDAHYRVGETDTSMLQDNQGDVIPSGLLAVHPPPASQAQETYPSVQGGQTLDSSLQEGEDQYDGTALDELSPAESDSDEEIEGTLQKVFAASQSLAAHRAAGLADEEEEEEEEEQDDTLQPLQEARGKAKANGSTQPVDRLTFKPIDEFGAPPHSQFVRSLFA